MNYLSTEQVAKKWNISSRRVLYLLNNKRIEGAFLFNSIWMIPENATKPKDARTKDFKENDVEELRFRFPAFEGKSLDSFNPPLTKVEREIKKITELYQACKFDDALKQLDTLFKFNLNKYELIISLHMACMIYIDTVKVKEFFEAYNRLKDELEDDFIKKNELSTLVYQIDATLGFSDYFINDFMIDPEYNYDETYLPRLAGLCLFSFSESNRIKSINDLLPYVYMYSSVKKSDSYLDLQTLHIHLAIEYSKINKTKEANYHFKKALTLAKKYELYYQIAMYYYYYDKLFETELSNFDDEFVSKIKNLSIDLHTRYAKFMKLSSLENIYNELSSKDYLYVYYAVQGLSNKEVASKLKVSESNVGNRYSVIYETLHVHTKQDLIDYAKKSVSKKLEK